MEGAGESASNGYQDQSVMYSYEDNTLEFQADECNQSFMYCWEQQTSTLGNGFISPDSSMMPLFHGSIDNDWSGDDVCRIVGDYFGREHTSNDGELMDVVFGPQNNSPLTHFEEPIDALSPSSHGPSIWHDGPHTLVQAQGQPPQSKKPREGSAANDDEFPQHESGTGCRDVESRQCKRLKPGKTVLECTNAAQSQVVNKEDCWFGIADEGMRAAQEVSLSAETPMSGWEPSTKGKEILVEQEPVGIPQSINQLIQALSFPPSALHIVVGAIGRKCMEDVPLIPARQERKTGCGDANCATRRHAVPVARHVHLQTRWLEEFASPGTIKEKWFSYKGDQSINLEGQAFKSLILSEQIDLPAFTAGVLMLRELEGEALLKNPDWKPRHYVTPQWATLVATGVISGDTSLHWFCSPRPPYNVRSSTMVLAPVYLHGSFSCYAMDFDRCELCVMDPKMSIPDVACYQLHLKTVQAILPEAIRCMQLVSGNRFLGTGHWSAYLLLTARRRCSNNHTGIVAFNCMRWFNGRNVCYKERENEPKTLRRTMVYQIIHMRGNSVDMSWLPAVAAAHRPIIAAQEAIARTSTKVQFPARPNDD
ncbi:hypothetical protein ACP70R_020154 [Stipagrostis hirtigluma subsp. patula]